MGQFKRRFYILGLSLLVLVIALAGLMGALDILNKPTQSAANPGGNISTTTPTTPLVINTPSVTPPPSQNTTTTPDVNITPKMSLSLPDSLKFDPSKATDPGLSLNNTITPIHYPILEVTGAKNTGYLKSLTSSYYDGKEWLPEDYSDYVNYNGELELPPGIDPSQVVTDNITVQTLVDIVNGKVAIPTSLYPVSVNSSEPLLYFPDDDTFLSQDNFPEEYVFQTIHFIFDRQKLANAQLDKILKYLQLPDDITPRTYELADNITNGIESPFLQAKAIEDYLKTNYKYDFNFQPAPQGQEPNDWFLFNEKSGVCTNFNSAFVILCRAASIPARLVGGFHITPQESSQEVFSDQAHAWAEVNFKDLGWYTFDATGSVGTSLTMTKTTITKVDAAATKGDEFSVTGTVRTDAGQPADGALVEILVNKTKDPAGATLVGKGIVADGYFKIQAVIPGDVAVGQYQIFAHCVPSSRYSESWSDPDLKIISGTIITLDLPARIKTGGTLNVSGVLSGEFGEAVAGQTLKIYLNGSLAADVITDNTGHFSWQPDMTEAGSYTLTINFAGSDYFLASSKEVNFRVSTPAVMTLTANGATAKKPVKISGQLTEAASGQTLTGRTLSVSIDNLATDIKPVTDKQGKFAFNYVFDTAGGHQLEVNFTGDADYDGTNAVTKINVSAAAAFSPWPFILIALAVIGAGAAGWFIYRRMKKQPVYNPVPENPQPQAKVITPWQSSGGGALLTIGLPQIKEPLPDVWGTGEELALELQLTDATGAGISAAQEVAVNDEILARPETGKDGKAEVHCTFPAKGQYNLAAKYEDPDSKKKAAAVRPVKIVDYREEIVSLFDKLVNEFKKMGIEISEDFTPRKIQYLVLNAKLDIPEKALEDVISCFEETDYSLHPITRQHYETMYLAQLEIEKHGTAAAV
jgi:transglutaminase-like putative cysteine protease